MPQSGNLLVLTDGRIGFIDFGIVGKISPKTWQVLPLPPIPTPQI